MLLAGFLARFVVVARTLWSFVAAVVQGLSRKAAWEGLVGRALSTGYRLWRRLGCEQSRLRTRLCRETPPPVCVQPEPLAQLLEHFRSAFDSGSCPFSSFQQRFQESLLA